MSCEGYFIINDEDGGLAFEEGPTKPLHSSGEVRNGGVMYALYLGPLRSLSLMSLRERRTEFGRILDNPSPVPDGLSGKEWIKDVTHNGRHPFPCRCL